MIEKNYPTKIVKYSGTIKVWPGDAMVYMPDGTVKTVKECFAGLATNKNGIADEIKKVEFYYNEEQKNEKNN